MHLPKLPSGSLFKILDNALLYGSRTYSLYPQSNAFTKEVIKEEDNGFSNALSFFHRFHY